MIDIRDLEHLGTDHDRLRDYYLDNKTGKVYVRKVGLVSDKREVRMADSELVELTEGEPVFHTDGTTPLNMRN